MSIIAAALKHLIAAGVSGDDLVRAVAEMEAEQAALALVKVRSPGALRTERWRARKAAETSQQASQSVTCDGSDECDATPPLSPSPLSSPQTPQQTPRPHTHPEETSRARKAEPFPRPEWADPQVWSDWMEVRRAKRARNTATAYASFLRDIERCADDEWPPGRLLEHAAARSWLSINRPSSESRNDRQPSRSADQHQNPYVRAVVARQASRAGDEWGEPGSWAERSARADGLR